MTQKESGFGRLRSQVVPLLIDNIDTDQIIPARFLKVTDRSSLGASAFADWRREPGFPLGQERYRGAAILLAGDNFGCGSSREHAPWALCGAGFRAVIAKSFGDIFRQNALKNALLPVALGAAEYTVLLAELGLAEGGATSGQQGTAATSEIEIDLERCQVLAGSGRPLSFEVDAFSRHCLLNGIDELDYLLGFGEQIEQYEVQDG